MSTDPELRLVAVENATGGTMVRTLVAFIVSDNCDGVNQGEIVQFLHDVAPSLGRFLAHCVNFSQDW